MGKQKANICLDNLPANKLLSLQLVYLTDKSSVFKIMPVNPLDSKISNDFIRKLLIPQLQGGGGGGSSNSLYSASGEPQGFVENTHGRIPRCHHIRVDGCQCGSPSLRGQRLCYFHSRYRTQRPPQGLPLLEDPNSIQLMVMQVMRGLMEKSLDQKTAGLLLYALQTAVTNSRRTDFHPFAWEVIRDLHGAIPHDATENEVAAAHAAAEKAERAAAEARAAELAKAAREAARPEKTAAPFRAKHLRKHIQAAPKKKQPKSVGDLQELRPSMAPSPPVQDDENKPVAQDNNQDAPTADCRMPMVGVPHSCEARVGSDEAQGPSASPEPRNDEAIST